MGSWRSGGGLFDGNVACGGRRLHLGQRSGSIVSHFVRCVLLRVRPCLAYYEIDQGDTSGDERTGALEALALAASAWVLSGNSSVGVRVFQGWQTFTEVLGKVGLCLFAFSMLIFGVQHFMYAAYIATLIPAWMPAHLFLTYFTGVAFMAAAMAIATRIQARLGAGLLGLMFLLWTILLHTPRVFAHIHNKDELTSLFVALAMSGGSFIVAGAVSNSRTRVRQTIG